jgi:GNAT superfamily N-acetyltransferase
VQWRIRPFERSDRDVVVQLSLRAWELVFASTRAVLGDEIDDRLHRPEWRTFQAHAVEEVCDSSTASIWVAEGDGMVAGFVAIELYPERLVGEIYLLAVGPEHQAQGLGTALTEHAHTEMAKAGMTMAMVETGGDPGHTPARSTYEKAGYTALPRRRPMGSACRSMSSRSRRPVPTTSTRPR